MFTRKLFHTLSLLDLAQEPDGRVTLQGPRTASQQAGHPDFALLHAAKHGVEGGARKDNRVSRGEEQCGARHKLDSTAAGTARAACLRRVSGRRVAMVELWRQAVKGDEL